MYVREWDMLPVGFLDPVTWTEEAADILLFRGQSGLNSPSKRNNNGLTPMGLHWAEMGSLC